jgi:hypothetical protein
LSSPTTRLPRLAAPAVSLFFSSRIMTVTPDRPSSDISTFRALLRLMPFARPVLSRLVLGAASAMLASLLALMFPWQPAQRYRA